MGRADGNRMTREQALAGIAAITRAVDIPVTADIETGYGDGDELAATIREVLQAGAIGVNLEDSGGDPLYPIDVAAERIAIARAAAEQAGVPLHINARVDVFFEPIGDPEERAELTVQRAAAYIEAGASSIFIPGVRDLPTIRALTRAIAAPINVLAGAGAPTRSELADAGVGRITVGSSLQLAILDRLSGIVDTLLNAGRFDQLDGIPYPELNTYFAARKDEHDD